MRKTILIVPALAVALLGALAIDTTPEVPVPPAPTAEQVRSARATAMQLRALGGRPGTVIVDADELAAIAALAGDARKGRERIALTIEDETLVARVSRALPLGLWLNATAAFPPARGFPTPHVTVGHLPVPPAIVGPLLRLGWPLLRRQRVALPQPDDLLRSLSFTDRAVMATVRMPPDSGLVRSALGGAAVDGALVTRVYCGLWRTQATRPSLDFAEQLRRAAAAGGPDADMVAGNRARLIALAMFVATPRAGDLTASPLPEARACARPLPPVMLYDRNDTAKHFALSAAIAATAGAETSRAIGEWKELADSLPQGSGFSFVDLAADRAGIRLAQQATDRRTAARARDAMLRGDMRQLLPPQVMTGREGLSEAAFRAAYRGTDSPEYARAVRAIDAALAREGQ